MSTNGSTTQEYYTAGANQYPEAQVKTETNDAENDLPRDEVGWYFVEQYYTTLSKSPEKLHLFYNKKSQFVSGNEAEVTQVAVGRTQIQQRIAALDLQDCKVRVTNVDSQGSFDNIVIQVIGETSNKGGEPKKFCQTFVLARQPTGFFVLNDIFRYIEEEGEESEAAAVEEPVAVPQPEEAEIPKPQAAVEQSTTELDANTIDKKLEEAEAVKEADEVDVPTTNGSTETPAKAEEVPEAETKVEEEIPSQEAAKKAVEEETIKEAEKPAEPVPTPAISRIPSQTKPATPVQPAAPAKPLTWASRAAAAAGPPKPAVPVVAPKVATPPVQGRAAAPPSTPSKPAQIQPIATAAPSSTEKAAKENEPLTPGGWQSVGNDHAKRQNKPQSVSGPPEKEGTMGYVRNVSDRVTESALKDALASYGSLIYFDINRSKNCAFVEFATPEGYQAAVAANPHKIAGEEITVEPRRPKATAYGGNNYTGPRGGINQRGRGNFEQGRPGSQGRGNFGAARGRGGAARGRGTSQTTNA